jgi:hypothetical protein
MAGLFGDFVIPTFLATAADLAEWTGAPAPVNATQLLRSATSLIMDATSTAYYDVDTLTGLATNALVKQAMNDATCIQAAAWAAIGYDPLTGGVITASTAVAKSIGTAHIAYADAGQAAAARADAVVGLVPEAIRILSQNNLLSPRVWVY